ncbi:MAG: PTS sugar transporter subunit IIC [Clostridia bacterium]|nr:PTS sugar transporter subunit IIC [Clostridia bacterium]
MIKKYLNRLFIDGLSGMASGLFATLIIGTILCQIARLVGDNAIGSYINTVGIMAKTITGAGIGVGVATKLKASPLTTVSAAVAGMVGAFPYVFANGAIQKFALGAPGEPLGAFVAAYVAIEVGGFVSGKTKLDIIVAPLSCISLGAVAAYFVGPPVSAFMNSIGDVINFGVKQQPIICGIIVSVVMGICLTLPISSAAIGISLKLSGLAAGAAVVGCCCNMVGFAVASYRENKMSGLISQGIGTSMLQMPNIVRKPIIWLPAIISSAILGPISTAVLKMTSTPTGSGMGTAGLVGPFETYINMVDLGVSPVVTIIEILAMHIILPAIIALGVSETMRKLKWIRPGDMRLSSI